MILFYEVAQKRKVKQVVKICPVPRRHAEKFFRYAARRQHSQFPRPVYERRPRQREGRGFIVVQGHVA